MSNLTYEANELYKRGNFKEAQRILEEKEQPLIYEDHIILGKIYLKQNLIKQALAQFDRCMKMDPKKTEAYLKLALYYLSKGKKQEEFKVLSEGLNNNKESKDYYYYLALYYYEKKEYENAKEQLINLFQLESDNLSKTSLTEKDFKILNAKVCYALNDSEPLTKLRIELKNSHEYYYTKYQIYKNEYDYANAKKEIKEAIKKVINERVVDKKRKLIYLCHQISIDYYIQNYQMVVDKFLQLLENNDCGKFTLTIYFYLASSYRHLGNITKYNEYMDLYENKNGIENEEYCLEKALYAISNNKDEECEKWFQKSIDINDKYIPTIYFKIHYLKSKGRKEEASELNSQYKNEIIQYIQKGSPHYSQSRASNINSIYISVNMNNVDIVTFPELSKSVSSENNLQPSNTGGNIQSVKKELIGKGGFSKVYLETTNGRPTRIIKEIIFKGENNEEKKNYLDKLKKEVEILMTLEHKNIIEIKGFYMDKMEIYLEYAEGGDLDKLLANNKALPLEFKIYLLKEIAEGLVNIHSKKIRHGDLKPKNILLSTKYKEGEAYPTPKICHFGLSSYHNELKGYTSRYAPPEVLKAKKKLTYKEELTDKSDIFSFGMTIYHILKGEKPFNDIYKGELADQRIEKGEIPNLDEISPDFCRSIIKKTLNYEPSKRPTAEEVLKEIKLYPAYNSNI